jgi:hypothetical protein
VEVPDLRVESTAERAAPIGEQPDGTTIEPELAALKHKNAARIGVFCALVALGVAVRLLSTTPNFSAVAAASLFAGFYFRNRATAVLVPLAIMTISDQFLGGYTRGVMIAVYAALLVPMAWSSVMRLGLTPLRVGSAAVSSSVAFYVLTNAAVWYAWYEHTWDQLIHCYARALPFFGYTLASDLLFSATFFSLYVIAVRLHGARLHTPSLEAV